MYLTRNQHASQLTSFTADGSTKGSAHWESLNHRIPTGQRLVPSALQLSQGERPSKSTIHAQNCRGKAETIQACLSIYKAFIGLNLCPNYTAWCDHQCFDYVCRPPIHQIYGQLNVEIIHFSSVQSVRKDTASCKIYGNMLFVGMSWLVYLILTFIKHFGRIKNLFCEEGHGIWFQ